MTFEPRPPPGTGPAHAAPLIDDVLARYELTRTAEAVPVADSVLNENFRVETADGTRFVRLHKKARARGDINAEHRMIHWAGDHGIPVNAPLATPDGATVHAVGGRQLALFPWLDGRTLARGAIDDAGAHVLGDMHGRLHAALAGYRDPALRRGSGGATWDTAESVAELSRVDDLIRYYAAPGEEWLRIQETLRFGLELLESGAGRPTVDFAALPRQAIHGDYHERNVMLREDGQVLAVVDWEGATVNPRVFELMRALDYGHLLGVPAGDAYLGAYAQHVTLSAAECRDGVEMWWQSFLHDTWIYRLRFIEGDRRVDRFFDEHAGRMRALSDPGYREMVAATLGRLTGG